MLKFSISKPKSLPSRRFGHNDPDDYCWEDWERDARANHPIRYFLTETIPHWYNVRIGMQLEHAWYWFKSHTYKKYHMVNLRHPGYDWGFVEYYDKLVYAAFAVFMEFYEDPMRAKEPWAEYEKEQKITEELYQYWVIHRPDMVRELDDSIMENWYELKEKLAKKDDEMLSKMIEIRRFMWI